MRGDVPRLVLLGAIGVDGARGGVLAYPRRRYRRGRRRSPRRAWGARRTRCAIERRYQGGISMPRRRVVLAVLVGLSALTFTASGVAAVGPIALTATCTDGGGAVWKLKSVWGARYRAGHGRTRVHTYTTGFTTESHGVEAVDYAIRTYSGSGHLLQTLHARDRRFDFESGKAMLRKNVINPPSSPGKARITVKVGVGDDHRRSCSVTFRQPSHSSTAKAAPAKPAAPGQAAREAGRARDAALVPREAGAARDACRCRLGGRGPRLGARDLRRRVQLRRGTGSRQVVGVRLGRQRRQGPAPSLTGHRRRERARHHRHPGRDDRRHERRLRPPDLRSLGDAHARALPRCRTTTPC